MFQTITGTMWVALTGLFVLLVGILMILVPAAVGTKMVLKDDLQDESKGARIDGQLDVLTNVCILGLIMAIAGLLILLLPDLIRMVTRT